LKTLKKCEKVQLSVSELEDDHTSFVCHEKYAKRLGRLWQQWCDIRGYQHYTGSNFKRPFKLSKSIVVSQAVRRDIDSVVTQYFKDGEVPDYPEIVNLIKSSAEKRGVAMKDNEISELARSLHQEVINAAKIRRERDREELLDLFAHEEHVFPSEGSLPLPQDKLPPELEKQIEENKAKCKNKLQKEFEKWETEEKKIPEDELKAIRENGDPQFDEEADDEEEALQEEQKDQEASPKDEDGEVLDEQMDVDDSTPPPSSKSDATGHNSNSPDDKDEVESKSPASNPSPTSNLPSNRATSAHPAKPSITLDEDDDDDIIILD